MQRNTAALTLCTVLGLLSLVHTQQPPSVSPSSDELWIDPVDLERRDLFRGPPIGPPPPAANDRFAFVARDTSGRSPGYDVRDANGVEWSVKLGPEAQTEVVASRILWAIGYHQMPTFYVTQWTMQGGPEGNPGPGRFRPQPSHAKVVGDWSWHENPFANTQPFRGLIVANLIINNWDWKTSNNNIYRITEPVG